MLARQQSVQQPDARPQSMGILQRTNSQAAPEIADDDTIHQMIITHNVIKSIKIISIVKEKDPVSFNKNHIVIYVTEIKTDFFDYHVMKRYKEFLVLHDKLKGDLNLPKFPEKRLFGSNKRRVIEERMQALQNFLQVLLDNLIMHPSQLFLQFIQIKQQFLRRGYSNIRLHGLSNDQCCLAELQSAADKKYQPQNDSEKMVLHYVNKLNQQLENRGKIFQKMEDYLFGKMQQVSYNMLQFLFVGDPDTNQEGLIHVLKVDNLEQEHHIACTPGLQLLRKLLEFDYNPYAEIALKAFCELNMKQMKSMKISQHIKGDIPKKCKQNALIILHKYVQGNQQLQEQFIKYLLEDEETYETYQNFKLSQRTVPERESLRNYTDNSNEEVDLFKSMEIIRKSSSKELNQLLEFDASPEHLIVILSKPFSWKHVIDYKQCQLSHLSAQIIKNVYNLPNCNLERAFQLFTLGKKWKKQFNKFEIIEHINESEFIAYESYTWATKQTYSTHIFISRFRITKKTFNSLVICVQSVSDLTSKQAELIQKNEIISNKISYIEMINNDNTTTVTTVKNLIDIDHKTHYFPQLLNEDQSFQRTIDLLLTMI